MHYNVVAIAVVLLVAYTTSFLLARSGRIRVRTHRAGWNIALLVALLGTGTMGVLMALRRDLDWALQTPFNLGFWHVELGVVLTLIALFHIGWHLGYLRDLLRRAERAERAEAEQDEPRE